MVRANALLIAGSYRTVRVRVRVRVRGRGKG